MDTKERNTTHIAVESFEYLVTTAAKHGLGHISLTGGEPTLHPELDQILRIVNSSSLERTFFHTNGVELTPELICGPLKRFTKVAVTIHASDYSIWHRITRGTKNQYARLWANLHMLGEVGYGQRLEIKHIPIRNINDSHEMIKKTLDLCARYGARFKFLILEPIERAHIRLVVPLTELASKLEITGCTPLPKEAEFRGQAHYLPLNWYQYKGTKGVAIEIGCGRPDICQICYKSNEVFVTPSLAIKPCHVSPATISLADAVFHRSEAQLLEAFVESRRSLHTRPGEPARYWHRGGARDA
jgi:molybdenum cofactor biosynthesis enzyme MoaA